MADVRTPELVINKLSKQQYENIQNPSDTELYLVPEDEEHKPICYPTTVSDVQGTSMVVKSSVSDNGKILTENGFVYNTSGNPTISDTKVVCDLGVGFMENVLENLTQNTEYHIKSYGQNSSGLVYGSELVQRTSNIQYQLVEYLESTGTQYIDTNIYPDYSLIVEMKIQFVSNLNSQNFFGSRNQATSNSGSWNLFYNINNNKKIRPDWIGPTSETPTTYNLNETITIILNCNNTYGSATINDVSYSQSTVKTSGVFSLKLFGCDNAGNIVMSPLRIMEVKFYRNNSLIKHLLPCRENNTGLMYDIVNGVFYTNQGTGEFIVGPDAVWNE